MGLFTTDSIKKVRAAALVAMGLEAQAGLPGGAIKFKGDAKKTQLNGFRPKKELHDCPRCQGGKEVRAADKLHTKNCSLCGGRNTIKL